MTWPIDATFDHCHFARISDTGATWQRFPNPTWWFIQNPLTLIQPNTDRLAPVIENARTNQKLAFCRNNSSTYLRYDSLVGDVDIIAKVYDKTGYTTGQDTWDKLAPYEIDYSIRRHDGLVMVPWTIAVQFSNTLDGSLVNVVYKADNTCRSRGDYDRREYYFIVTNTDGDSIIESSDTSGVWNTGLVGDTTYWVCIRASDVYGNTTLDSMLVTTRNGVGVEDLSPLALSRPLCVFPNPGPAPVRVSFGLGRETEVRARIVDAVGRVAANLASGRMPVGDYRFEAGRLNPGVYSVRLVAAGEEQWQKLVVTRQCPVTSAP